MCQAIENASVADQTFHSSGYLTSLTDTAILSATNTLAVATHSAVSMKPLSLFVIAAWSPPLAEYGFHVSAACWISALYSCACWWSCIQDKIDYHSLFRAVRDLAYIKMPISLDFFCACFSPPLWLHSSLCAQRDNKNPAHLGSLIYASFLMHEAVKIKAFRLPLSFLIWLLLYGRLELLDLGLFQGDFQTKVIQPPFHSLCNRVASASCLKQMTNSQHIDSVGLFQCRSCRICFGTRNPRCNDDRYWPTVRS